MTNAMVKIKGIIEFNSLIQLAGMIGPVELPFDGCPIDACASMATGGCPTEVGETLVYELDFEVNIKKL